VSDITPFTCADAGSPPTLFSLIYAGVPATDSAFAGAGKLVTNLDEDS